MISSETNYVFSVLHWLADGIILMISLTRAVMVAMIDATVPEANHDDYHFDPQEEKLCFTM